MFLFFERLLAYRYLRSPRQEGFISVIAGFSFIGIALGVAILIIVMSVMNGFRQELLTRIIGMRGHILVQGIQAPITNYHPVIDLVRKVPGVEGAFPVLERQAIMTFSGQARGVSIHAMDLSELRKRSIITENIKAGTLDDFQGEGLLIGSRLAEFMHLKVGDRIAMITPEGNVTAFGTVPRQKSFIIKGVFQVGMHDYDKNVVFMPLVTAQNLFKLPDQISHIEIFSTHIELAPQLAYVVQQTLGNHVQVLDWQHGDSQIFHAVQIERNVMFLILTLIILIASFNIISSLIMLVKDKTRDIAILRTMGASRGSMMRIFFLIGATIGAVGTLIGVILGLSFSLNIESIRQFLQNLSGTELFSEEIYFLTHLPAKVDGGEVCTVVGMSLLLSFLATLYPAWRAARLDPVEALRF
ncbi:MAG: lipoprotein-releasing ABC transporter permease subunit [Alphaproteobacteria bacterium]|nr:lipoprotein-releasing ABC transporter permease subunit [Alphaproteobacteria bacterium]